jgi:hypothetical protein
VGGIGPDGTAALAQPGVQFDEGAEARCHL